jgi:hypothetical protein
MRTRTRLVAVIVLCVLALTGCRARSAAADAGDPPESDGIASASPSLPPLPGLPSDFPLTAGWADDGVRGQERVSLTLPGCGGPAPYVMGTDRLAVSRWRGRWRQRQLTTYEDTGAATAAVRRLVRFYRPCPDERAVEAPSRTVTSVRAADIGDVSWAVTRSTTIAGRPRGAEVLLVVQVGLTVLIDWSGVTYRPGTRGADQVTAQVARQVDEQAATAAPVVAAMCAYAEGDC